MPHSPSQLRGLPKFDRPFDAYKPRARLRRPVRFLSRRHEHSGPRAQDRQRRRHHAGRAHPDDRWKEERFGVGSWYHVPANVVHAAEFAVPTSEVEFWFG